jgi:hypothetical protein
MQSPVLPEVPDGSHQSVAIPTPLPALEEEVKTINIGPPKASEPEVVINNDTDVKKRRIMLIKLRAFKDRLGHKLPGIKLDNLEDLPVETLEKLLQDCEFSIGLSNSTSTLRGLSKHTFDVVGSIFSLEVRYCP